jgi:hypothetical protein
MCDWCPYRGSKVTSTRSGREGPSDADAGTAGERPSDADAGTAGERLSDADAGTAAGRHNGPLG